MTAQMDSLSALLLVISFVSAYKERQDVLEEVSEFEVKIDNNYKDYMNGQSVRRLGVDDQPNNELSTVIWSGALEAKFGDGTPFEQKSLVVGKYSAVMASQLQKTGYIRLHDPMTPMSEPDGRVVAELDRAKYSICDDTTYQLKIDDLYYETDKDTELKFQSLFLNCIDPSQKDTLIAALSSAGACSTDDATTSFKTPSGGARQLWFGLVQLRVSQPAWSQIARMVTVNAYPSYLASKTGVTGLIRWTRPEGAKTGTVKNRELLITNLKSAQFNQEAGSDGDGFQTIHVSVENVYDVLVGKFVTLQMKNIGIDRSAELFKALVKAGANDGTMSMDDSVSTPKGTLLWQGWVERKFDEEDKEWGGPDRFLQIIDFPNDEMRENNGIPVTGVLTWKRPDALQTLEPLVKVRNMFVSTQNQAQFTEGFPENGDDFIIKIDMLWDEPTQKWRTLYLRKVVKKGGKGGNDNVGKRGPGPKGPKGGNGNFKRWIIPALADAGVIDVTGPKDFITFKDGEFSQDRAYDESIKGMELE